MKSKQCWGQHSSALKFEIILLLLIVDILFIYGATALNYRAKINIPIYVVMLIIIVYGLKKFRKH